MASKKPQTQKYSDKQVAGMRINPYAKGDIFDAHPQLRDLVPPDTYGIDMDRLFRCLAFIYEEGSPMVNDFPEIKTRIEEAARETGVIAEHIKDYTPIIVAFLRSVSATKKWAELIVLETLFWDYCARLTQPLKGDMEDEEKELKAVERQGIMSERLSKFRASADALRASIFAGDKRLEQIDVIQSGETVARIMQMNEGRKRPEIMGDDEE